AGYRRAASPDKQTAIRAALAMAEAGADIIEVGLPYSDPLIDGPVIADAVYRSLKGGAKIQDVFDTVQAAADASSRDPANAGGAGLITPDLTPEEAGPWLEASDAHNLDRVFLVAPSSPQARIAAITRLCRGFVYAVSLMGITGARDAVSSSAAGVGAHIREHTSLPAAVGLGVSTGAQAREVAGFADGVIVGYAFVRRITDAATPAEAVAAVRDLPADLAQGGRRG